MILQYDNNNNIKVTINSHEIKDTDSSDIISAIISGDMQVGNKFIQSLLAIYTGYSMKIPKSDAKPNVKVCGNASGDIHILITFDRHNYFKEKQTIDVDFEAVITAYSLYDLFDSKLSKEDETEYYFYAKSKDIESFIKIAKIMKINGVLDAIAKQEEAASIFKDERDNKYVLPLRCTEIELPFYFYDFLEVEKVSESYFGSKEHLKYINDLSILAQI